MPDTEPLDPAAVMAEHAHDEEGYCSSCHEYQWASPAKRCLSYRLAAELAEANRKLAAVETAAHQRETADNLTPEQVATVKFAAAVIEAELGGRRTSQAARDLRAMLPPDPVLQHQFNCPTPTRGGHCTCAATVDYGAVSDHVADVDLEENR